MFISRKRLRSIEERLDNRAHTVDFEFWRREVSELRTRLTSLEESLGLNYSIRPSKPLHTKKGGPEKASHD